MSDYPSQHEFDDELLSAYLDDELSPDQRADVENRLTTDPAARQMLDKLRSVSQSLRDLPKKTVGHDLRDAVLRQVQEVRPVTSSNIQHPANGAPESLDGSIPKITIFRTTRAWVWASLAVAAALLIMFIQSDPSEVDELPAVAQQHREPPVLSAAPEPAPPATAFSRTREFADADAAMATSGKADLSSSTTEELLEDRFAAAPPESDLGESPANDSSLLASRSPLPAPTDEQQLVVVHVRAKRDALENRSFDRLLASKGIVVEPALPAAATDGELARRSAGRSESEHRLESATEEQAEDVTDMEVVLVEAPPMTIVSFLAELNRDSINYLGVAVADSPTDDEASTRKTALATKAAVDLGKFSRGVVPQQQKDAFARDTARYYQFEADADRFRDRPAFGGQFDVASGVTQDLALPPTRSDFIHGGRAKRVQLRLAEDELKAGALPARGGTAAPAPADIRKLHELHRQLKAPTEPGSDTLQVLFVLSADDQSASSPAAENRAQ